MKLHAPHIPADSRIERAILAGSHLGSRPWQRRLRRAVRPGVFAGLILLAAVAVAAGWWLREQTFARTADRRMWMDAANAWNRGWMVYDLAMADAGKALPPEATSLGRRMGRWIVEMSNAGGGGGGAGGGVDGANTTAPAEALAPAPRLTWAEFWRGYVSVYGIVAEHRRTTDDGPVYGMDYAPARLFIVAAWMKHVRQSNPADVEFDDRFLHPMTRLNTAFTAAGAAAVFVLLLAWLRRCDRDGGATVYARLRAAVREPILRPGDWPIIAATLGAILFWLNPSTILNAHGFVQWDAWILPFVALGMAAAATGHFGLAGLALGLSFGFKGQAVFALPLFALWPMFRGRFGAAARFVIGAATGVLAWGLPWLVNGGAAWLWVGSAVALSAVHAPHGYPRQVGLTWWLAAGVTTALLVGPYANEQHVARIWIPLLLTAAMIVLPWLLPQRRAWWGGIVGVIACAAVIAAADRFGGSWDWFRISYLWPSYQYRHMAMGPTSNLPALLESFGWRIDDVLFTLPMDPSPLPVTLRQALVAAFAATLALCAVGAARKQATADPALPVAMAAPWVLAFALLPQMHERYLVWGAALVLSSAVACSGGLTLLSLVLVALSCAGTYEQMLAVNRGVDRQTLSLLSHLRPGTAWLLLLSAAVFLYAAVAPGRGRGVGGTAGGVRMAPAPA